MATTESKMNVTERYGQMAAVFKAMGHPARLLILQKLREREHCVCELQEAVGSDMSTVSRHLAVLKNAGIIGSEKKGNWIHYRLLCPCVMDACQCVLGVREAKGGGA